MRPVGFCEENVASGGALPYKSRRMSVSSSSSPSATAPVTRLKDLSAPQWKSGIAAWLGWLFDGLDLHLYTLVATSFVAMLLGYNYQGSLDAAAQQEVVAPAA